jgi:Fe-S-cluster containining protein
VHIVKEQRGPYAFSVLNRYTNEVTEVEVDPDKHELFDDKSIFEKLPDACPFFRHRPGTELAYCTVHATRPSICRDYACWRLLILDHRGRRVGKIKFIRTFQSDDPDLTRLFESCEEIHREPDDAVWEEKIVTVLTRAGYAVRK